MLRPRQRYIHTARHTSASGPPTFGTRCSRPASRSAQAAGSRPRSTQNRMLPAAGAQGNRLQGDDRPRAGDEALQIASRPEESADQRDEPDEPAKPDGPVEQDRGDRDRAPLLLAGDARRLDDVAADRAGQEGV